MNRALCCLVTVLVVLGLAATSGAWEFSMSGEFEWRFRYFGRLGGYDDLFGNMLLQDAGGPLMGFAGPNLWGRGAIVTGPADSGSNVRIVRGGFSESDSDAHYNDQRLSLYPKLVVNKAVSFTGLITFGGYRNKYHRSDGTGGQLNNLPSGVGVPPFERYYMDRTSVNAFDTAAIPSLEQWKLILRTPLAIFSIGIKDFPIGIGATLGKNTRASSLFMIAPYGPFDFYVAWWPGRTRFTEGWETSPDGAEKNQLHGLLGLKYKCGPMILGWVGLWRAHHSNAYEGGGVAFDDFSDIEVFYGQFANGRFFANAEFAYFNIDRRRIGAAPTYIESHHVFGEAGVLAGPVKLSLMAAQTSGPVLNDGNPTKSYLPLSINYQAMEAYEWLMFNTYGGGNNGGWLGGTLPITNDDHGQMADAYAFGARVDYAVAANLNLWASYIWAHRTEVAGWYAGGTASDGGVGNASPSNAQTWKQTNGLGAAGGLNPYVDDGFIGWEMGVGLIWQILDATTIHVRYAYWQPGEWFDQAYQAVVERGGAVVTDGLLVGRDSINAFETKIVVDF